MNEIMKKKVLLIERRENFLDWVPLFTNSLPHKSYTHPN